MAVVRAGQPMSESLKKVLVEIKNIEVELRKTGWEKILVGKSPAVNFDEKISLFKRVRNLSDLVQKRKNRFDEILKTSSNTNFSQISASPVFSRVCEDETKMVSKASLDTKQGNETFAKTLCVSDNLPVLSGFANYASLVAARTENPAVVIAYDSEWFTEGDGENGMRHILSWQFALIVGKDLVEYVFLRKSDYLLSLELALGRIFDDLDIEPFDARKLRKYTSLKEDYRTFKKSERIYDTKHEAQINSDVPYPDGKCVKSIYDWKNTEHLPVTLLCHAGKADLSALDQAGAYHKNVLVECSDVQGGLVSLKSFKLYPKSTKAVYAGNNNPHIYALSVQIGDTMCHASAGMKSLKDLGKYVGWEKIELDEGVISHMDKFLVEDPCGYYEYASNDSVVTLLYGASLYGYNRRLPVTVTSATAKVMKQVIMAYMKCSTKEEFERKYRGLGEETFGYEPMTDRPGYIKNTAYVPISDKANTVQYYASRAYHGGHNSSSTIGYFPQMTYDYDLQNAYPTAMCLIPDIDWEHPYTVEISNRELT